jgi:hypothetical protein
MDNGRFVETGTYEKIKNNEGFIKNYLESRDANKEFISIVEFEFRIFLMIISEKSVNV